MCDRSDCKEEGCWAWVETDASCTIACSTFPAPTATLIQSSPSPTRAPPVRGLAACGPLVGSDEEKEEEEERRRSGADRRRDERLEDARERPEQMILSDMAATSEQRQRDLTVDCWFDV